MEVADSGTGIPSDIRDRVFEPFFTTKEIGKGTGLGLSTSQAIIKSHGGFITLQSEIGRGSRFKIYLPTTAANVVSEYLPADPTGLPQGKGETILVVDDEQSIRSITKRTLERFGYRVLTASHGAEAISVYAQNQEVIRGVLTDMAMPIMDGASLVIALKAINPDVRIICSSGLSTEGGTARATSAGVKHFIPKPYTAFTILNTLRELLSHDDSLS